MQNGQAAVILKLLEKTLAPPALVNAYSMPKEE